MTALNLVPFIHLVQVIQRNSPAWELSTLSTRLVNNQPGHKIHPASDTLLRTYQVVTAAKPQKTLRVESSSIK